MPRYTKVGDLIWRVRDANPFMSKEGPKLEVYEICVVTRVWVEPYYLDSVIRASCPSGMIKMSSRGSR
jgi:hypothetical protein